MAKRLQFALFAGALVVASLSLGLRPAGAGGEEVDVIVNKANPTGDLPLVDARKFFMGDKSTWANGKRVTILMLAPGQPERAVALREIYKMSEGDYAKYFMQAAFQGKVAAPPKDVASGAQMKQAIADNAGAIGYVKKEDVDDTVKVILKIQRVL
jgi:ABC-type phosphate transport system substrate-binding protein